MSYQILLFPCPPNLYISSSSASLIWSLRLIRSIWFRGSIFLSIYQYDELRWIQGFWYSIVRFTILKIAIFVKVDYIDIEPALSIGLIMRLMRHKEHRGHVGKAKRTCRGFSCASLAHPTYPKTTGPYFVMACNDTPMRHYPNINTYNQLKLCTNPIQWQ